jgi:hypothetical protein
MHVGLHVSTPVTRELEHLRTINVTHYIEDQSSKKSMHRLVHLLINKVIPHSPIAAKGQRGTKKTI